MKKNIFSIREIITIALLGIFGVVAWGLYSGQDLGPDLLNYHFYNGYLASHKEKLTTNFFPADMQGYMNPYAYALVYKLYQVLSPVGVGVVLSALHGLCFIAVYIVSKALLAYWPEKKCRWMALACATFGVMNPFFLGMVGSSFSDNLTPPLILIPLCMLLLVRFPDPSKSIVASKKIYLILALSGFMMGIPVGLKLTNAIFVLGLMVAWFFRFSKKHIMGSCVLFGAIMVGFLTIHGEWMWRLYSLFHNPFFPFFNTIFKSSLFVPLPGMAVSAAASAFNLHDLIVFPFRWMVGIPNATEWNFRDARFAIIYILLAGVVLLQIARVLLPVSFLRAPTLWVTKRFSLKIDKSIPVYAYDRFGFIAIWSIFSYLLWIKQFGAMRYLMPITLLSGIFILLCLILLIPYRRIVVSLWVILVVVSLSFMQNVYFGRVPWKKSWYPIAIPEQLLLSKNTLYFQSYSASSFVIPFLPYDSKFMDIPVLESLPPESDFTKLVHDKAAHHEGPIRTLAMIFPIGEHGANELKKFGLRRDPRDCIYFQAGVYPVQSCRLEHIPSDDAPFVIPLPTKIRFDQTYSAWIKELHGFYGQEPGGLWTQGNTAEIDLEGVLPKIFQLRVSILYTIGENGNLPLKMIIGAQEKEFTFQNGAKTATISFTLQTDHENKIVIKIPKPISPHAIDPNSGDTRELGVFLHSIVIEQERTNETA